MSELYATLRKIPSNDREAAKTGDVESALAGAAKTLNATYQWPFQLHASIGPSCGLAHVRDGEATIWSGTQGAHQLRPTIAQLLGISPANVRVVFVEASGCYGHNGADDAAADAALLSQAVGKPVRVQWMRHDEHGWEPLGPAMVIDVTRRSRRARKCGRVGLSSLDADALKPSQRQRRESPGRLPGGNARRQTQPVRRRSQRESYLQLPKQPGDGSLAELKPDQGLGAERTRLAAKHVRQ